LAIRQNLVSFPSQVPTLKGRQGRDIPERAAQLYFVRGWSVRDICDRYSLNKAVVRKMLSEWRSRAIAAGYIQDIHPETLEALTHARDEPLDDEDGREELARNQTAAERISDRGEPSRATTFPRGVPVGSVVQEL
jgi:DNA-binding transcriptional regulator LsrR (DeoR family)